MNLCSDNHEEICHEGRYCPVCAFIDELKEDLHKKDKRISELENENNKLMGEISSLEDRLSDNLFELKEMYKIANESPKPI